mmetsp:Transcript_23245/g.31743  ORF Transcript_23245/g.31743 Transcript_23245/m.31743 type:complete len:300 (+) Transcript_23245:71-970(+)
MEGKSVFVTAPTLYASRLAKEVEQRGGKSILVPTIETNLILPSHPDWKQLEDGVQTLSQHPWILFTSRNGILAVMKALLHLHSQNKQKEDKQKEDKQKKESNEIDDEQKSHLQSIFAKTRIAAIGKDADLLSTYGLKADLVPDVPSPQGIVDNLTKIFQQESPSEPFTCLVPAPVVRDIPEPDVIPKFVSSLEKDGFKPVRIGCYITSPTPDLSLKYESSFGLLSSGKIDVVAFSSTAEVTAILTVTSAKELKEKTTIACFGPITAGNTEKLGVHVDLVAKDFSSFAGFCEAIDQYFSH